MGEGVQGAKVWERVYEVLCMGGIEVLRYGVGKLWVSI